MRHTPTPLESFGKNLFGFLVFIGVSIGLTVAVNVYLIQQQAQQQAAVAAAELLRTN